MRRDGHWDSGTGCRHEPPYISMAGLYPGIDGLTRYRPEVGDRVAWRARPGETTPDGARGTAVAVSGSGEVTAVLDIGGMVTAWAEHFSPLADGEGNILKGHVCRVGCEHDPGDGHSAAGFARND